MMDEQALFDEMMSQPLTEDEREMVSDHLMQQAILQRDQRIAALEARLTEQAEIMNIGIENGLKLEAELQPWREMARQLGAMAKKEFTTEVVCVPGQKVMFVASDAHGVFLHVYGDTLPAAVAAAYEQVMGVGDE